jgi:hypothetical protein
MASDYLPLVSFDECVVHPSTLVKRDQREVIRSHTTEEGEKHIGKERPKRKSEAIHQRRVNNTLVKRYQREVIRSHTSKKGEQHIGQKISKGGNQKSYIKEG